MHDALFNKHPRRQRSKSQRNLKAAQRSLETLRRRGYHADVCERYCAFGSNGGFRKDLFGFADILAYDHSEVLLIQTTSRQQMSAHVRLYRRDEKLRKRLIDWLQVGSFVVHGWEAIDRPTKQGGFVRRWQLTERWITQEDLV